MRLARAATLLAALGIAMYSPAAQAQTAASQGLSERWNAFNAAIKSKDAAKVASFYTAGALLLDEGRPLLKGRAAIEKSMAEGLKGSLPDIATTVLDLSSSGDMGYVVATFTQPSRSRGQVRGKLVMIWKRVDGVWMIAHDMFNTDGAASPASK